MSSQYGISRVCWTYAAAESGEDSEPMPGSDAQFQAEAGPSRSRLEETAISQLIWKVAHRLLVSVQFIFSQQCCRLCLVPRPLSPRFDAIRPSLQVEQRWPQWPCTARVSCVYSLSCIALLAGYCTLHTRQSAMHGEHVSQLVAHQLLHNTDTCFLFQNAVRC